MVGIEKTDEAHLFGFKLRFVLLSVAFWLIGFVPTFVLGDSTWRVRYTTTTQAFKLNGIALFHSEDVLLFILVNNIGVGLILSLGGFFTGGLLTVIVNIWNGIFFGLIVQVVLHFTPAKLWLIGIHGPTELLAFALFSAFGLEGFVHVKHLLKDQPLSLHLSPQLILRLWLPLVLLVVAACLETMTINRH